MKKISAILASWLLLCSQSLFAAQTKLELDPIYTHNVRLYGGGNIVNHSGSGESNSSITPKTMGVEFMIDRTGEQTNWFQKNLYFSMDVQHNTVHQRLRRTYHHFNDSGQLVEKFRAEVASLFTNVYIKHHFGNESIKPNIGFGWGLARYGKIQRIQHGLQLLGDIDFKVMDNFSLSVMYKYTRISSPQYFEKNLKLHNILLGAKFQLWTV